MGGPAATYSLGLDYLLCNAPQELVVHSLSWKGYWILLLNKNKMQKWAGFPSSTFKTPLIQQPVKKSQYGKDQI